MTTQPTPHRWGSPPEKLLREWERNWGSLTPELRERFLARPEVAELGALPSWTASTGLRVHKHLDVALRIARSAAADEENRKAREAYSRQHEMGCGAAFLLFLGVPAALLIGFIVATLDDRDGGEPNTVLVIGVAALALYVMYVKWVKNKA